MDRHACGTNSDPARSVATSAEILPDGSAIELVASDDEKDLALLHWDGERVSIAMEIPYGEVVYRPPTLHASIRRAIRLPSTAADYGSAGTLFQDVLGLMCGCGGLPNDEASKVAYWVFTTWFADLLPSPPALTVSGLDLNHAIKLFRLIGCVCRRGLPLADMTRSAFNSLPMELRPTVMLAQPAEKLWPLWIASNHRGMFVPGKRGMVLDLVCSKALFLANNGVSQWSDQAIHLILPPAPTNRPQIGDRELKRIADEFQPKLLSYRLHHLHALRETRFPDGVEPGTGTLENSLKLCVPNDPEVMQGLVTLLDTQDQDRREQRLHDPVLAILEVLWTKLQDPPSEISVGHLAELTNALLRSRGASRAYSPEQVGRKLRKLGIRRHPNRRAMMVKFSRETSLRAHKLVKDFGLKLPRHSDSCIDCVQPQVIEQ